MMKSIMIMAPAESVMVTDVLHRPVPVGVNVIKPVFEFKAMFGGLELPPYSDVVENRQVSLSASASSAGTNHWFG
jgi:hypothetical protein